MTYLESTQELYKEAAINPMEGLCCTTSPVWKLPGLNVPQAMLSMNYGCGTTVSQRDLDPNSKILYIGAGGGLELLQFSYFTRKMKSIIGIDAVDEMLSACSKNLEKAAELNEWFQRDFIDLKKGNALDLEIPDGQIDIVAQNCLFNIFKPSDLQKALEEAFRVLRPGGRLILSDPTCEEKIPDQLKNDDRLRALCLSGALPIMDYTKILTDIGFATIEVRARRPYRILSPTEYDIEKVIFIESVEIAAIKDPMPSDGPCIFTGKTAIYHGEKPYFDDEHGHILIKNQPMAICDKTANDLKSLNSKDIFFSPSTFFYDGGGCC
jgi:SAM-dependent methyltransferase